MSKAARGRGRDRGDGRRAEYTNLDRRLEFEQDGLGDEDLTGLGAEVADFGLEELDLLARSATADLQETIDDRVEVDFVLVRHRDGRADRRARAEGDGSRGGRVSREGAAARDREEMEKPK